MEPAGLTLGVVGLTGQLANAAVDCYKIFDDMSDVGSSYDSILHKLRTEGLRLKGWEEAWGLGGDVNQGRLNPEDYRYRYATASLARIVAAFGSVDKLQAKYGIVAKKANGKGSEEPKPRRHNRLSVSLPFRSRSKSAGRELAANIQLEIPTIHENELYLLENPRVLGNQQLFPGLPEEISSMTEAIDRVQQSLPMYHKLRWVVSDKGKLDDLLRLLTSLNDGLFQVLPESAKPVIIQVQSQVSTLKLSFDIPFLPSIRKSSEFVGREYLLENLKQEVEEGNHTQNIVVLYGTGGMGKTQLVLEYIHQHHKDHSSVFWINAASAQSTILGFAQIMQRLIEHHAQVSGDYSHIGRLLGMSGKLDSNGCFSVAQPSEAQYVVGAVKRWFALPGNTNWLLAFDNLDNPDILDIEEYLPVCSHGTVIITSRRRDLQQGRRGFEVQQMEPSEAIQMLLTACGMPKFEDLVPSGKLNLPRTKYVS